MKYKKTILVISVVLSLAIVLFLLDYANEKQIQESQKAQYLSMQEGAASKFVLEVEEADDEGYLIMSPTEETEMILDRWKAVSDAFPSIEYPTEELGEEDWVGVVDVYLRNQFQMQEETKKVIKELDLEDASVSGIDYYISYQSQPSEHATLFRELLEEHYLE